MQNQFQRLLSVQSADPDVQRRGRNVILVCIGLIAIAGVAIPLTLASPSAGPTLIVITLAIAIFLVMIAVARRGRVDAAALVLIGFVWVALVLTPMASGSLGSTQYFLVLPVLLASVTLRTWQMYLVLGLTLVGMVILGYYFWERPVVAPVLLSEIIYGVVLATFGALVSGMGMTSTDRALRQAREASAQAEAASAALAYANVDLERRVQERTAELERALAEQAAQARALENAMAMQQRLNETIAELSVPVLPIRDDVLVAPLVGTLDSVRAEQLLTRTLEQIERRNAAILILDITGVPVVDTQVAQALVRTAQAARLLGARVVLVGIRPEVAQTLVGLGVDLSVIETLASLQQSIEAVRA